MPVYSETFKKKLVERMLMPNPRPMTTLARDAGVAEATMYRWRNEATLKGVSTDRSNDKAISSTKPPHAWDPEEKLAVVLEASAVPEAELGAFLRRKGIHEAQLVEWRKQVTEGAVSALRGATGRDRKAHVDAKRVRELERELARKDKALAEAAALLMLKKKAQAIWGDEDDDTTPENDE
jgi:transposase